MHDTPSLICAFPICFVEVFGELLVFAMRNDKDRVGYKSIKETFAGMRGLFVFNSIRKYVFSSSLFPFLLSFHRIPSSILIVLYL
jgi:hypothetical protein